MKMRDIMPEHVRQWVTKMQAQGASARTIQYCKTSILNAIFTTALDDEVVTIHPSRGVKTPPVPEKARRIITAAQFGQLYEALPDEDVRLLAETDIESGLRWGELTELRVRDLDLVTRILTVSRAVVEVPSDEHPSGGRFLVKDYPKDKEYRRLKLSAQITTKLAAHITARGLGSADLLFTYQPPDRPAARHCPGAGEPPGMTEPDQNGRRYRHGTLTAYNAARCRCGQCRGAYASYRATRRAVGKGNEPDAGRVCPHSMIGVEASDQDSGLRLAELLAAFSLATDSGMGQPMEHVLLTCQFAGPSLFPLSGLPAGELAAWSGR